MFIDVRQGVASMRTFDEIDIGYWSGVTDFAPLDAVAVSPEVVELVRRPLACSTPDLETDAFEIGTHEWARLKADLWGCKDGPAQRLRQALDTLFSNLKARDARDAGSPRDAAGDSLD